MEAVLGILNNPVVLTVVQILFGFAVKRWSVLASWPNKLIPLFNAVLALLIKLAVPEAEAAGIGEAAKGFGSLVLESVLQTIVSTGLHSSGKNFIQQFFVSAARKVR